MTPVPTARCRPTPATPRCARTDPPASTVAGVPAPRAGGGSPRRRQHLAWRHDEWPAEPLRRAGPRHLRRGALRGPPRAGPGRPTDRPDPFADRRDARRDLAPPDAAASAGPRGPELLRHRAGARPGTAHLAARGDRRGHDDRDRRPIGPVAAALQVHVGGGRGRPAAAHLRARNGDQRPASDAPDRTDQRPADRTPEGHPRGLPRGLPVGEPRAPRRAGHAPGPASSAPAAVSRADGRDVGDRPRHRRHPSATSGRRFCSSGSSWRCCTWRPRG